jgi:hypothetical protein
MQAYLAFQLVESNELVGYRHLGTINILKVVYFRIVHVCENFLDASDQGTGIS